MRTKSLKKQTRLALAVLMTLFVALVLGYAVTYYRSVYRQYRSDLETVSDQYTEALNQNIFLTTSLVDRLFSDSIYYRNMALGKIPDYEWARSSYHIKTDLTTQVAALPFTGALFFYDRNRDALFSSYQNYGGDTLVLNNYFKEIARKEYMSERMYYGYIQYGDYTFLVYFLSLNGCPVGALMNLTDCFSVGEELEVLFVQTGRDGEAYPVMGEYPGAALGSSGDTGEGQGEVIARSGKTVITDEEAISVLSETTGRRSRAKLTAVRAIREFPGLSIVTARAEDNRTILRRASFWALLLVLSGTFVGIYLYFLRVLQLTLLNPVSHLYNRIRQIEADMPPGGLSSAEGPAEGERDRTEESDQFRKYAESVQIEEYMEINGQIDHMLQQIADLRESRLQDQIRTKEALLQYYQLQTNPHFFLSCLNTVSSLLERGRGEIADGLIQALSAHFRYMFRGNRTLVTLNEEMKAARDYCDIYRIRSGFPILISDEVSEEAGSFQVPLLSVMTFVENSIKHFGKLNKILSIRVHAEIEEGEDGAGCLNLRITDNGKGYSEENLKELNLPVDSFTYEPNHVGVRNLKYRFRLLYGDRAEWYFYNSPYGAATVELRIAAAAEEKLHDEQEALGGVQ